MTDAHMTRDDDLAGKVAVVTGGVSGIGLALAVTYARAGARTVLGYYPGDPHDPDAAVAAVRAAGGDTVAVAADVADPDQVDALVAVASETYGRLDIAVASAGILRRAALPDLTDAAWDDMLSVDLTGVMRLFRSASAAMGDGGSMVALSSIAGGVYGWEEHAHYAAAKAGVLGMCRSLAVELAPQGIRVNAVVPGLIESPQSLDEKNSLGTDGLAQSTRLIPLRRVGTTEDAARTIRFLTSADAAYVTGQALVVDGGLTIQWPS